MERTNESKTITQIDKAKFNAWDLTFTISRKIDNTVKTVAVAGYGNGGNLNVTKDIATGSVNINYNNGTYDPALIPAVLAEIEVIEAEAE